MLKFKQKTVQIEQETKRSEQLKGVPTAVDWQSVGCDNVPKNQSTCGADYAFVAAAAMEDTNCLQGNPLIELSMQ